ncbi:MAG: PDZ domain-containing protein [Actinobacteria bacterium]|nr:PDZ domain-containing protein [Actinomycetota bacterium]MBT3745441.1 PDZ domain-containing protein [Actinomycetota bacterium]MBT3970451.1 PDZ domain-containing protein [Actinomycetota bacterium]MBT4010348.1 PDZ domain-containing protein [Actinomycetota bacterium]MBT4303692.1 PDZ domain-containing protein [Actinomycetota bacterium]
MDENNEQPDLEVPDIEEPLFVGEVLDPAVEASLAELVHVPAGPSSVSGGRRTVFALVAVLILVGLGGVGGWLLPGLLGDEKNTDEDSLISIVMGEAPVLNPGDEPVVAVAQAVSPSVVLVEIPLMGQGSGIIMDQEGHIVTNGHVIGDAELALVTLPNGQRVEAEIVGVDIRRDVSVIRLTETVDGLVPAVFGPSDELQVGQLAVAVGSPFGLSQSVTSGIISALGRVIPSYGCEVGGGNSAECAGVATIQTDAPINPGNSGGPLADRSGRVIGMNTSIRTDGVAEANAGIGFALPIDTVLLVAERLLNGEPVGTAWLGIRGESPSDGRSGAVIVEITEGSPAALAGLQVGDLIVSSEGVPMGGMGTLRADIQLRLPGMVIELGYQRDGVAGVAVVELGDLDSFLD